MKDILARLVAAAMIVSTVGNAGADLFGMARFSGSFPVRLCLGKTLTSFAANDEDLARIISLRRLDSDFHHLVVELFGSTETPRVVAASGVRRMCAFTMAEAVPELILFSWKYFR